MSTDFTDRPYPFPDRPPPPKSKNTLLIVLAVLGGVMLLCGGCVFLSIFAIATLGSNANGTFTYVATKVSTSGASTLGAEGVADRFLQEIERSQYGDAYDRTSRAFKQKHGRVEFQNLVLEYPTLLAGQASHEMRSKTVGQTSATITYRVKGADLTSPPVDVELKLIQEDGAWRIDQMNLSRGIGAP